MSVNKFNPVTSVKAIPFNGPTSSEDIRNFLEEVVADLTEIERQWNAYLVPLLDSLPTGNTIIPDKDRSSTVNPFANGFDGSQVYVDKNSKKTDVNADILYSSTLKRPLTLKESLIELKRQLISLLTSEGLLDLNSLQERVEDLESDKYLANQIPSIIFLGGPGTESDPDYPLAFVPVYNEEITEISITEPNSYPGIVIFRPVGNLANNCVRTGWQLNAGMVNSENPILPENYIVDTLPSSDKQWTMVTNYPSRNPSLANYQVNDILVYTDNSLNTWLGMTGPELEVAANISLQTSPWRFPSTVLHSTQKKSLSLSAGLPFISGSSSVWKQTCIGVEAELVDLVVYLPLSSIGVGNTLPTETYYGIANFNVGNTFKTEAYHPNDIAYRMSYVADADTIVEYTLEDLVF